MGQRRYGKVVNLMSTQEIVSKGMISEIPGRQTFAESGIIYCWMWESSDVSLMGCELGQVLQTATDSVK